MAGQIRAGLFAAFVIVGSANPIWAADGDRMVYGAGMVTCSEWRQYRATDKSAAVQLQAWIDGFLSTYNLALQDKDFLAPELASVAYYAWIDNYCGQNPLDKVIKATIALKNELAVRAR